MENKIKIIPLGGLGEIGKNMTVIQYNEDLFVVDAGLAFPDEDMLGVEVIIPDFDYLRKNKEKIRGFFITHAHEDHIGAIPYLAREFRAPMYATQLTATLIQNKLKKKKINQYPIQIVKADSVLPFNDVTVSFFGTNHSIPDSIGMVFKTPVGTVVHTGDFKIDYNPIDKNYLDFQKMGQIGKDGVLVLLSDSTNATKPGVSISEQQVKENLKQVINGAKGRIIVATFASSLHRVQSLLHLAKEDGRKVVVLGGSMENNVKASLDLGYLKADAEGFSGSKNFKKLQDREILIITTGAQGESLAGLARMANGEHQDVQLKEGDTVIFSSSPIPGNEKSVNKLINNLLKKGVEVKQDPLIHTSGHGYQEEQKLMLSLFRPQYFIPAHGEYKMLVKHGKLAEETGVNPDNIFICENGDVVEFTEKGAKKAQPVQAGPIMIDGSGLGEVDVTLMRDRKRLATHGFAVVQYTIYKKNNEEKIKIKVILKGIAGKINTAQVNKEVADILEDMFKEERNLNKVKKQLYENIGKVIYKHTKRRPMIVLLPN